MDSRRCVGNRFEEFDKLMDSMNQWDYLRRNQMEEYGSLTLFGEKSFVGDVSDSNKSTLRPCVARNSIRSSAGTGNGCDTEIRHSYATRKSARLNTDTKIGSDTDIRRSSATRKRAKSTDISASRPKGVVLQRNGNWGCQIYANHQRFWLGTFKTEKEAAMAYDSVSLKLRSASRRNYTITDATEEEQTFQSIHSTESVINMIRDGTYQIMFAEFMKTRRIPTVGTELTLNNIPELPSSKGLTCEFLFQKELTPSDVGKLNRLVIPKKYAVMYFPRLAVDTKAKKAAKDPEDMELSFYDRSMKLWTFKYSYWSSSQSYVFTKGWNRFVEDKQLKTDDFVTFSRCESQGNANLAFFMIDVKRSENQAGEVLKADLLIQPGLNVACEEAEEGVVEEEEAVSKEKQGLKLFGVRIF